MARYQLILVNNSGRSRNLVVYQQYGHGSTVPIAWRVRPLDPTAQATLEWDTNDWDFIWAKTSDLSPGTVVKAGQVITADPKTANHITLFYDLRNRAFYFGAPAVQGPTDQFGIFADGTLPANAVAGGIGMAGSPTYLVMMRQYITYQFAIEQPQYWVTYGAVEEGQCFPVEDAPHAQVAFPTNVTSMTATLNSDDTWTIRQNVLTA